MKANILKSIFWAISIMIGLILVYVIKGTKINLTMVIISGIVASIIDFTFSIISDKRKKCN